MGKTRTSSRGGFLLVDKPAGFTSHDVVALVRRELGERRVGHAGTLDPAATGLLILGVGRSTRLLTFLVGSDKSYDAVIRLGAATVTDDAEGDVLSSAGVGSLTDGAVRAALSGMLGPIKQRPSAVSAVHVDGRRAHERVRAGESVELPERSVTIHDLELHEVTAGISNGIPVLDLSVSTRVSSGTYIRAIARDLGATLGCGGHLRGLRRTHVGPFDVDEAVAGLEKYGRRRGEGRDEDGVPQDPSESPLADAIWSPDDVATRAWPGVTVTEAEARAVTFGQRIPASVETPGIHALFAPDGQLLAMGEVEEDRWRYRVVLLTPDQLGV